MPLMPAWSKTLASGVLVPHCALEHTHMPPVTASMIDKRFTRDYAQLFPSASISYKERREEPVQPLSQRSTVSWLRDREPFHHLPERLFLHAGQPGSPVLNQSVEATWAHNYSLFTTVAWLVPQQG